MARYAIVDSNDQVINVIVLEPGAQYQAPEGCTLVEGRDWPQPDPSPPAPPLFAISFLPQDLLALLTPGDSALIRPAVAASDGLWLLWQSFVGQKDPIDVTSERSQQGWAGLTSILGAQRVAELKTALNIA